MDLITEIAQYDNDLYYAKYKHDEEVVKKIWESIKNRDEILTRTIEIYSNSNFEAKHIIPLGKNIIDQMLKNFDDVSSEIYRALVSKIYEKKELARTIYYELDVDFGGSSYLCMTLRNQRLILSETEKAFAINEAMNTLGSTKFANNYEAYKASGFDAVSTHSGIQLLILRNHNFLDRFPKLVHDFWADDEEYEEVVENLINHAVYDYLDDNGEPFVDITEVEDITEDVIRERVPEYLATDFICEVSLVQSLLKVRPVKADDFTLETGYSFS